MPTITLDLPDFGIHLVIAIKLPSLTFSLPVLTLPTLSLSLPWLGLNLSISFKLPSLTFSIPFPTIQFPTLPACPLDCATP